MIKPKVSYTRLADATIEDREIIQNFYKRYRATALPTIVELLFSLKAKDTEHGWKIDRYMHSLQTATRAFRDEADEELVVVALLHDIGEAISPDNHSAVSAEILKPFISEENHWLVRHHGIFQGYHYLHLEGKDRNIRDNYKGNSAYEKTVKFCAAWDQESFDPNYETLPFEHFVPMLENVISNPVSSL